jgi:putative membrane protein
MAFLLRLIVNAAALWVAVRTIPGVTFAGGSISFFGAALVFGVVNAFLKPLAKVLAFPLIIVTLGLFTLVVNGIMLWITSAVSGALDLGFHVSGFWSAFFGALVVSIVSTMLSALIDES